MRKLLTITFVVSNILFSFSQKKAINYFFSDCEYDTKIPTPESILGYQVGEWHASHDQVVMYLRELAKVSPRIVMKEYARSYENRPLYHLYITSEANHNRLGEIQKEHIKLSQPDQSAKVDISKMPSVVYQGFSIHGNEPSGGNASMLVAYHLAAGKCAEVNDILDNVIILLDPVYNPDGFHRFSTWANSHKSKNMSSDPNDREYNEVFPRGRTNHYWFDLNRDWLLLAHPESRGRVAKFQEWKPNILTDHHEMGTNQTFFFMPGIQTRIHPLTPKKNQELTAKIGTFHAKALDKIGSLYFTEERYDDYYYGKGSTYPDANGSVGILFEQASSRGHLQETDNGLMSFPFTIRNQTTTAMSTLRAAASMREELLDYQREFYQSAMQEAKKDTRKGFVFSEPKDKSRLTHFVNLLQKHDIKVQTLQQNISAGGKQFEKEHSYFVPLEQPQYRLIKSVFDPIFKFDDSLFYDVSAFTLPMAYNIDYQEVTGKKILNEAMPYLGKPEGKVVGGKSEYAYLFEWNEYYSPNALNELLSEDLIVKVGTQQLKIQTSEGMKLFDYGTIQIPVGNNQKRTSAEIFDLVKKVASKNQLKIYGVKTGLTPMGSDLGSGDFKVLKKPEVLLLVGSGVNSYDAGEVWHLLDQRYDMPITKMDVSRFSRADLSRYNVIVMVDGSYNSISSQSEKLKTWVQKGGTLIPFKRAIRWAKSKGISKVSFNKSSDDKSKDKQRRPYEKQGADAGAEVIGGAIFATELDLTHPLGFGYHNSSLPIFRRGTLFLEPAKNPYATPLVYTSSPLLSGYISKKNLKTLSNSASIVVSGMGRGKVINMADNTNFRAFWYGTNKLFANAIFFGNIIGGRTVE
ncbi:M14 family metallopeptidase [Saprospiraceae bacterium]|nr:M14 family metallopeptidase [Saprospiraceae bacterium]